MTAHKPDTPLPWHLISGVTYLSIQGDRGETILLDQSPEQRREEKERLYEYIVHVSNAYPRLVAALRHYTGVVESVNCPESFQVKVRDYGHHARDILHDLGES